ncbi:MAG TPA: HD domain-containing protein [bacterium]|nr:HD domain-containing protein [bacterium]
MKPESMNLSLFDLVRCFASAMDLVSSVVGEHQRRVSCIAYRLASEMGLSEKDQEDVSLAGAMHDCGVFSLQEKLALMSADSDLPNIHRHAEIGYRALKKFPAFERFALIIRYHHLPWHNGAGAEKNGERVPIESHIIHLADRIDTFINRKEYIIGQTDDILRRVQERSDDFAPQALAAFDSLQHREFFWLDVVHGAPSPVFDPSMRSSDRSLGLSDLEVISRVFCQLMDFRSHFTATHSSGVAATAEALARLCGFSDVECQVMRVAGQLHDLGKFAIPVELLEKPAHLTDEEFRLIRSHTYHTNRILKTIPELNVVNAWGSLHHEKLNGRGYPFHMDDLELSEGSRIMAVADVFTALTEDRPYRKGMTRQGTLDIMKRMAHDGALDQNILETLERHFEFLESIRIKAQEAEAMAYYDVSQVQN